MQSTQPGQYRTPSTARAAALVREYHAKLEEQRIITERHRAFVAEQSRLRVDEPIEACGWEEYRDMTAAMMQREEMLARSVARMRFALRSAGIEPMDYVT